MNEWMNEGNKETEGKEREKEREVGEDDRSSTIGLNRSHLIAVVVVAAAVDTTTAYES